MKAPKRPRTGKGSAGKPKAPEPVIMTEGRNLVEYLKELYTINDDVPLVQESELRLSQPIVSAQGVYTFQPVSGGQYSPNPVPQTDQQMDKADIFAVSEMCLFLTQRASLQMNASTTYGQYLKGHYYGEGDAELLTYPDLTLLDQYVGAASAATQPVDIQNMYQFYNGFFKVVINSQQLYDYLPSADFLYVPVTQKDAISAVIGDTSVSPPTGITTYGPFTNMRSENSGFRKLANVLQFSGSGQNNISLNIPTHAGSLQQVLSTSAANMAVAGSTATYANFVGIRLKGALVKNRAY